MLQSPVVTWLIDEPIRVSKLTRCHTHTASSGQICRYQAERMNAERLILISRFERSSRNLQDRDVCALAWMHGDKWTADRFSPSAMGLSSKNLG